IFVQILEIIVVVGHCVSPVVIGHLAPGRAARAWPSRATRARSHAPACAHAARRRATARPAVSLARSSLKWDRSACSCVFLSRGGRELGRRSTAPTGLAL